MPAAWMEFRTAALRISQDIRRGHDAAHWHHMFDKACNKMATLSRMKKDGVYVGVGILWRGVDLTWRLNEPSDTEEYFRLMPLPDGVISLYADQATIIERNKGRPRRDLGHLSYLNDEPRERVTAILRERGCPVLEVDTRNPVEQSRATVLDYVGLPAQTADAATA
jgi:hypothetical protein